jgi:hypothetical protein
MGIVTGEMAEEELRWNEDGREIEAHAQHDAGLGVKSRRSRYQVTVAATQNAAVKYEERSMCGKRTQTLLLHACHHAIKLAAVAQESDRAYGQ